jgi:hypothetical protein
MDNLYVHDVDSAMTILLQLLVKTQKSPFDIKIVYQRKNKKQCHGHILLDIIPTFTVANMVTRVDTDGAPSKLTQYAMELLTSTLAQLGSDTQTQGKAY